MRRLNTQQRRGRIVLRTALVPGNVAENLGYEGWLYAAVATPNGDLAGLYITKDFGQNWTKIRLPVIDTQPTSGAVDFRITNDGNDNDTSPANSNHNSPVSSNQARGGNYAMSLAVDPTNPDVIYFGGTNDNIVLGTGLIRIDITGLYDPHNDLPYEATQPDGGAIAKNIIGAINVKEDPGLTSPDGTTSDNSYLNLIRDPMRRSSTAPRSNSAMSMISKTRASAQPTRRSTNSWSTPTASTPATIRRRCWAAISTR